MADTYVTLRVREALKAAGGSRSQAQRVLIAMALDDEQLLRGLCQPFLKAIAASAVERVVRDAKPISGPIRTAPPSAARGGLRPQKKLSGAALDALVANMGRGAAPAPLAKADSAAEATPDQANAMKALAAAFKDRR